jgi:hypothetical protein
MSTLPARLVHTLSTVACYPEQHNLVEEARMDKYVRHRGVWIAVLALAAVGMCILLAAFAGAASLGSGRLHMQPSVGQEGGVPLVPPYGPFGVLRPPGAGLVRFVFLGGGLVVSLLVVALVVALLAGFARRVWRAGPPYPPPPGRRGAWHGHRHSHHPWPPEPEPGSEPPPGEEEPDAEIGQVG